MKKKLHFYLILLFAPFTALILISNSGGANAGFTGSPSDVNNCKVCHVGADTNTTYGVSVNVNTNIPAGGYALGQTYTITVTQTFSGAATKHGFEITAENGVGSNVGTFVITDATNTQFKGVSNEYVTHTASGNALTSWTFDWTAPSFDVGTPITFYVATIAGTGGASGSEMALKSKLIGGVLGINDAQLLNFTMYPNPSDDIVSFQLPSNTNKAQVTVFDYLGKSLLEQNISPSNKNIDISKLSSGIYFVRIQTNSKVGTKKLIVR
ncbi:MAG: T9SS type A sorting domain-containing protein [Flavobacteriaceae bacterium]